MADEQEPQSQARIEITNYVGYGLGIRPYVSAPDPEQAQADYEKSLSQGEAPAKEYYVTIAAIVYDDNGNPTSSADVTVTTDDEAQGATFHGTGMIYKPVASGVFTGTDYTRFYRKGVAGYSFTYLIKTPGEHTITFTFGSVTKSVTFTSQ